MCGAVVCEIFKFRLKVVGMGMLAPSRLPSSDYIIIVTGVTTLVETSVVASA